MKIDDDVATLSWAHTASLSWDEERGLWTRAQGAHVWLTFRPEPDGRGGVHYVTRAHFGENGPEGEPLWTSRPSRRPNLVTAVHGEAERLRSRIADIDCDEQRMPLHRHMLEQAMGEMRRGNYHTALDCLWNGGPLGVADPEVLEAVSLIGAVIGQPDLVERFAPTMDPRSMAEARLSVLRGDVARELLERPRASWWRGASFQAGWDWPAPDYALHGFGGPSCSST